MGGSNPPLKRVVSSRGSSRASRPSSSRGGLKRLANSPPRGATAAPNSRKNSRGIANGTSRPSSSASRSKGKSGSRPASRVGAASSLTRVEPSVGGVSGGGRAITSLAEAEIKPISLSFGGDDGDIFVFHDVMGNGDVPPQPAPLVAPVAAKAFKGDSRVREATIKKPRSGGASETGPLVDEASKACAAPTPSPAAESGFFLTSLEHEIEEVAVDTDPHGEQRSIGSVAPMFEAPETSRERTKAQFKATENIQEARREELRRYLEHLKSSSGGKDPVSEVNAQRAAEERIVGGLVGSLQGHKQPPDKTRLFVLPHDFEEIVGSVPASKAAVETSSMWMGMFAGGKTREDTQKVALEMRKIMELDAELAKHLEISRNVGGAQQSVGNRAGGRQQQPGNPATLRAAVRKELHEARVAAGTAHAISARSARKNKQGAAVANSAPPPPQGPHKVTPRDRARIARLLVTNEGHEDPGDEGIDSFLVYQPSKAAVATTEADFQTSSLVLEDIDHRLQIMGMVEGMDPVKASSPLPPASPPPSALRPQRSIPDTPSRPGTSSKATGYGGAPTKRGGKARKSLSNSRRSAGSSSSSVPGTPRFRGRSGGNAKLKKPRRPASKGKTEEEAPADLLSSEELGKMSDINEKLRGISVSLSVAGGVDKASPEEIEMLLARLRALP